MKNQKRTNLIVLIKNKDTLDGAACGAMMSVVRNMNSAVYMEYACADVENDVSDIITRAATTISSAYYSVNLGKDENFDSPDFSSLMAQIEKGSRLDHICVFICGLSTYEPGVNAMKTIMEGVPRLVTVVIDTSYANSIKRKTIDSLVTDCIIEDPFTITVTGRKCKSTLQGLDCQSERSSCYILFALLTSTADSLPEFHQMLNGRWLPGILIPRMREILGTFAHEISETQTLGCYLNTSEDKVNPVPNFYDTFVMFHGLVETEKYMGRVLLEYYTHSKRHYNQLKGGICFGAKERTSVELLQTSLGYVMKHRDLYAESGKFIWCYKKYGAKIYMGIAIPGSKALSLLKTSSGEIEIVISVILESETVYMYSEHIECDIIARLLGGIGERYNGVIRGKFNAPIRILVETAFARDEIDIDMLLQYRGLSEKM